MAVTVPAGKQQDKSSIPHTAFLYRKEIPSTVKSLSADKICPDAVFVHIQQIRMSDAPLNQIHYK